MATSSIVMLSSASMERLYHSQPPTWVDLQRLPFSLPSQQQQDGHHQIRSCYDKLLHHMYDVNSSTFLSSSAISQLNEQLELAAEYCQLKTLRNGNTFYLHSDQFYVEITFHSDTHLPCNVYRSLTTNPDGNNDQQQMKEERLPCPHMLKALNKRKYRLFRAHLSGYTSLFTLTSPNISGNDKRFGYTVYTTLENDLEQLIKTPNYRKLFQGFQSTCEGLPMRIRFDNEQQTNTHDARIILVTSTTPHLLPVKSMVRIENSTGNIHLDSTIKNGLIASGHFALEFDENHPPFIFLHTHVQQIARLTGIDQFWLKSPPAFNYLNSFLPKMNDTLTDQYHWHISQDMSAVFVRQIPFTHIKQLVEIVQLIRQQERLKNFLNQSFHIKQTIENEQDENRMDDEDENQDDRSTISFEFSLRSSNTLSVTCGQSHRLVTFLLDLSDAHLSPTIIFPMSSSVRQEIHLSDSNTSFLSFVRQILKQNNVCFPSPTRRVPTIEISESVKNENELTNAASGYKLARRLSCGPPAKPAWRSATTLRRTQPACLTLSREQVLIRQESKHPEQDFLQSADDEQDDEDEDDDDDTAFLETPSHHHQQLLPKPSLSFHPPTLSTCTSVSSTQSISTPPIFGLSPTTPYPGAGGNVFFPPAKQVSVHDFSPVNSPVTFASFDPTSAFLATTGPSNSNSLSLDMSNKMQPKKKRRRSEHSNDDFMQTLHDGRSSVMHATKLASSGDVTNVKRGKKVGDKNQSQLMRQKSAFKVADSASLGGGLQQVASPDDSQAEFKPLKVVIKRVGDGASSSNDESQQQITKLQQQQQQQQRKKQQTSVGGLLPTAQRKMTGNNNNNNSNVNNNNNPTGGISPAVLIKSESIDMSDSTGNLSMSMMNDGQQQRERPRPSSSLSNPSSSLSTSATGQPRSVPPQPPIVLKIHRSKIGGAEQSTSPGGSVPSAVKEAFKHRNRSMPSGAGSTSNANSSMKQHVISPPLLATKLSTPPLGSTGSVAAPATIPPSYRIPRKSSSQELSTKIKTEPGVNTSNSSSPVLSTSAKPAILPAPGGSSDLAKLISKPNTPVAVRPSLPAPSSQIGSWQPPPTQQPLRAHSFRPPRTSWSHQPPPARARTPITPPNVSGGGGGYPPVPTFTQQPRSILKKAQSSDNPSGDHHFMPISDLISSSNDHRIGSNFAPPPPPPPTRPRTATPPGMYDDNDDDSSPQAQLVIDTSSNSTNNALLPYALLPASTSASSIDDLDQSYDNNATGIPPSSLPSQSLVDDETPSHFA